MEFEYTVTWVRFLREDPEPVRPEGDGWDECHRWQLLDRWRDEDGQLADGYNRVWVWRRLRPNG